ncbi:MAG: glycoside hydrolase 43 family protein [Prevotella sp.]
MTNRLTRLTFLFLMFLAGMDATAQSWTADNGNGTYTNPLFYDEFSDPDVIRVGDDYYLAGTTMHCLPGVVILHSKDLVNWEFCSYAMNDFFSLGDEFQLKNGREAYGQGIWAPCIRYHNGKFYVFSNINGHGMQVFIADKAEGPWRHINMRGNIYDLSVLFDDDGKVYAIHKYGAVRCTEIKPDFSGFVEGSDREIIPDGSAMGEGHHAYKLNGKYYIISTDYSPMGRQQCAVADNIWGPYETRTISMMETLGTPVGKLVRNVGLGSPVPEAGYKFDISAGGGNYMGCATIHQGGIVDTPDGQWWAVSMLDFQSVGRTVCLVPVTWKDGYPYFGLEGNLGRCPRTWFKPEVKATVKPAAPYERSDSFDSKTLGPVWQWNHEPLSGKWALKNGRLNITAMPAKDFLWARNTLTQRAIGPVSRTTVMLDASRLRDGDIAGLGVLNIPYAWIAAERRGRDLFIVWYDQNGDKREETPLSTPRVWMQIDGDYDNGKATVHYSTDGEHFNEMGDTVVLPYQLKTFQGIRLALFAYNAKGRQGGVASFDNFTVTEPMADRSRNIPLGRVIRLRNIADGSYAFAHKQGVLHSCHKGSAEYNSKASLFKVHDRGRGCVVLEAMNGAGYVTVVGEGLSADVRLLREETPGSIVLWQDMLRGQCMLLSLHTQRMIGIYPRTGAPYAADIRGADPDRKNGPVFCWEEAE